MAGVLHDYECPTHGVFEARAPRKCPFKGCTEEITRVFLKAPGLKSDRTKQSDATMRQLAMDYRMTDVKSVREGESQAGFIAQHQTGRPAPAPPPESRPGDAVMWGSGGGFNLNSVLKGGAARSIAGESVGAAPKDVGIRSGPKTGSYVADHEKLQPGRPPR